MDQITQNTLFFFFRCKKIEKVMKIREPETLPTHLTFKLMFDGFSHLNFSELNGMQNFTAPSWPNLPLSITTASENGQLFFLE